MLAVVGCCRNPGGAGVPVDARIELGLTTRGVGVAAGCATIPSVESGTTGFGTGVPVSGGSAASAVSSSWGTIDVSSSDSRGSWQVSPRLWPGCAHQRLGITDGLECPAGSRSDCRNLIPQMKAAGPEPPGMPGLHLSVRSGFYDQDSPRRHC